MALWNNPVFRRESLLRLGFFLPQRGLRTTLWTLGAIGLVAFALLIFFSGLSITVHGRTVKGAIYDTMRSMKFVDVVFGGLLASWLSGSAISGERRKGTWDATLQSGLSVRQILTGKFWGSLTPLLILCGFSVVMNLMMIASHRSGISWQICLLLISSLCILVWFLALNVVSLSLSSRFPAPISGVLTLATAGVWAILPNYLSDLPGKLWLSSLLSPIALVNLMYGVEDAWVRPIVLKFLAVFICPTLSILWLLHRRLIAKIQREYVNALTG